MNTTTTKKCQKKPTTSSPFNLQFFFFHPTFSLLQRNGFFLSFWIRNLGIFLVHHCGKLWILCVMPPKWRSSIFTQTHKLCWFHGRRVSLHKIFDLICFTRKTSDRTEYRQQQHGYHPIPVPFTHPTRSNIAHIGTVSHGLDGTDQRKFRNFSKVTHFYSWNSKTWQSIKAQLFFRYLFISVLVSFIFFSPLDFVFVLSLLRASSE